MRNALSGFVPGFVAMAVFLIALVTATGLMAQVLAPYVRAALVALGL